MLDQYYVRPGTIDRIRGLWLGLAIERYVESLSEKRAAVQTVRAAVQRLVRFNAFALSRGACPS